MEKYEWYKTEFGVFTLKCKDGKLTGLSLGENTNREIKKERESVMDETAKQLSEYFKGLRTSFSIPLAPKGTEFQKKVWDSLCRIPYGETRSYKQVAVMAGNEKASRAVGMANNKNPIMIIIPCHRVIGSNGDLVGYGGGLDVKVRLLTLEGIPIKNQR